MWCDKKLKIGEEFWIGRDNLLLTQFSGQKQTPSQYICSGFLVSNMQIGDAIKQHATFVSREKIECNY